MYTEGTVLTDWLKWEEENLYSREAKIIKSGEGVVPTGTILKDDAGKLVKIAAANDTAVGILVNEVDATSADVEGVVIVRMATVTCDKMTAHANSTLAERKTLVGTIDESIVIRDSA